MVAQHPDDDDDPADDSGQAVDPADDSGQAVDPIRERIELGVELLANLEHEQLPLRDAVDRIETITTDPAVTREILDTAELRGVIDREAGIVRPNSHSYVSFESDIVSREGEFTCKRCGASLSIGYFISFEAAEHGPFGSSCIRKVTGRE